MDQHKYTSDYKPHPHEPIDIVHLLGDSQKEDFWRIKYAQQQLYYQTAPDNHCLNVSAAPRSLRAIWEADFGRARDDSDCRVSSSHLLEHDGGRTVTQSPTGLTGRDVTPSYVLHCHITRQQQPRLLLPTNHIAPKPTRRKFYPGEWVVIETSTRSHQLRYTCLYCPLTTGIILPPRYIYWLCLHVQLSPAKK